MIDDVEVVLLDDAAPTSRTVELRPRRRWRELALVVAAIAAVVGVGLVGDDEAEEAEASPTTTTSERRSTTTSRTATTRRPALAQPTTTRRPTTTTSWPQLEAGTGPVLPGEPSGNVIGLITANGLVTMIDLATGDRCRTRPAADGVWMIGLPAVAGMFLVQSGHSVLGIDRSCAVTDLDVDLGPGYPVTATAERFWLAMGEHGEQLVEHALPDGTPTGREVLLPRYTGATSLVLGDDLVVGASGRMTLVDPDTDERRDLGPGNPLATHGSVVAYMDCPEMRCALGILDVATGERRVVDGVEPVSWELSTFSADGRMLRVPVPGDHEPSTAVVDLQTDEVWILDEPVQNAQITADDRWLIAVHLGEVVAFRIGSDERVRLLDGFRDVQGFALL